MKLRSLGKVDGMTQGGRDGCCEIPCIPEHNWDLAVAENETGRQPQTRDSGLLPNGYATWDQSFSLPGL